MDIDTRFARIFCSDVSSPTNYSVSLSDGEISLGDKLISLVTFSIEVTVTVPEGGYVKFKMP
jgi:hypothetical protein